MSRRRPMIQCRIMWSRAVNFWFAATDECRLRWAVILLDLAPPNFARFCHHRNPQRWRHWHLSTRRQMLLPPPYFYVWLSSFIPYLDKPWFTWAGWENISRLAECIDLRKLFMNSLPSAFLHSWGHSSWFILLLFIIIIIIINDNLHSAVCTKTLQGRLQNENVQWQ